MGKYHTKIKPKVAKLSQAKAGSSTQKCTLKEGEIGSYGQLLKRRGGNQFDRDHSPSAAALLMRAQQLKKAPLTADEKSRVKRAGLTIALKKTVHRAGRTYGGKNTKAQILADSKDLAAAHKKDVAAYAKLGMKGTNLKAMRRLALSKPGYDKMLRKALKSK
jgi:hypothetical protein